MNLSPPGLMSRVRGELVSSVRLEVLIPAFVVTGAMMLVALGSHGPYAIALMWAALVLASFVGWGTLMNLWIAPQTRVDWGLRAAWGMSLSFILGGYLCLVQVGGRRALIGQVAVGLFFLIYDQLDHARREASWPHLRRRLEIALAGVPVRALLVVLYGMLALVVLAAFGDHRFQPSDDPSLYMVLPKKLVETGTIFDPFAARRIPVLGGHVYVHALFLAVASPYYLHVVDGGICVAIVFGLAIGHTRGRIWKESAILPLVLVALVFFSLRSVRVNTGSIYSGAVGILALFRSAAFVPHASSSPLRARDLVLLAGAAAAPILLRSNLITVAVPFAGLLLLSRFVEGRKKPWERKTLVSFLEASGLLVIAFTLMLLPWSISLHQSCGTLFYPIGKNDLSPGVSFMSEKNEWIDILTRFIANVFFTKPIAALLPFLFAGLVPLMRRGRTDLACLVVASVICLGCMACSPFSPNDNARYCFAAVAAVALLVAASAGQGGALATLAGVAVAVHLAQTVPEGSDSATAIVKQAHAAYAETSASRASWDDVTREYADVQSHIRPGATMVAAVREAFRFDFRRNTIFTLDSLGAMGPKPGWPSHQGPEALASYLRQQGIDYLVHVDWREPGELYSRDHLRANVTSGSTTFAVWGALQLDAEDAIDGLARIRRTAFVGHGITVIDLASP